MIRTALSLFVSGLVLLAGTLAALVQSDNFERGARLDHLQLESEWCQRRATQLRAERDRLHFEFSATLRPGDPPDTGEPQAGDSGDVSGLTAGFEGTL